MFKFMNKFWLVVTPPGSMRPKDEGPVFRMSDEPAYVSAARVLSGKLERGEITRFQYTWQAYKELFWELY